MAQKKNFTNDEKVAEILKRAGVSYDPKKAREQIALNTRCRKCGRTLSSLERVVFEDKCRDCMVEESKKARDKFVRKYIIISFFFIVALFDGVLPTLIIKVRDFIRTQLREFQYLDDNGQFQIFPEYPEFA